MVHDMQLLLVLSGDISDLDGCHAAAGINIILLAFVGVYLVYHTRCRNQDSLGVPMLLGRTNSLM